MAIGSTSPLRRSFLSIWGFQSCSERMLEEQSFSLARHKKGVYIFYCLMGLVVQVGKRRPRSTLFHPQGKGLGFIWNLTFSQLVRFCLLKLLEGAPQRAEKGCNSSTERLAISNTHALLLEWRTMARKSLLNQELHFPGSLAPLGPCESFPPMGVEVMWTLLVQCDEEADRPFLPFLLLSMVTLEATCWRRREIAALNSVW